MTLNASSKDSHIKVVQTNKAYFPHVGGIETIITNLAEGLQDLEGVSVEVLACKRHLSWRRSRSVIRNVNVTLVPSFGTVSSLPISPSYMLELGRLGGDILHIHEPFPLADLALVLLPNFRKRFSRIVVSWHSDIIRQKWALSLYLPILRRFLDRVDRIVVATPHHITSSTILPSYSDKCVVIPYGIKLDWAWKEPVVNTGALIGSRPRILSVGRLVYYKGLDVLIDALTMVSEADLLIVGSGPLYHDLRERIDRNGLANRVRIVPHTTEDKLHEYYKTCDIFVLASTAPSEAFGIVQVEAMACGKPVISTNLGTGVTYVNQESVTGLTVPPGDSHALAQALTRLINDPSLRSRLGSNARTRVLKEFTQEIMIERTVQLYQSILNA